MLAVDLSTHSERFLKKLLPKHRRQVATRIFMLAENPHASDTSKLRGSVFIVDAYRHADGWNLNCNRFNPENEWNDENRFFSLATICFLPLHDAGVFLLWTVATGTASAPLRILFLRVLREKICCARGRNLCAVNGNAAMCKNLRLNYPTMFTNYTALCSRRPIVTAPTNISKYLTPNPATFTRQPSAID